MTTQDKEFSLELSRRKLLAAAGIGGSVVLAPYVIGIRAGAAAPDTRRVSDLARAPPVVAGLHLQFGGDASSEIVVSWHTLQPVSHARVLLGLLDGKLEQTVEADETSYTDAKSGQVVYAYHAKLGQLQADAAYLYGALHEGAQPEFGTFRTAPRCRARFTFTSFGDQGTPTLGRRVVSPAAGEPRLSFTYGGFGNVVPACGTYRVWSG
jgi:phosphodiesterase/alkaline phosphatase D-like protein